jgi:hypothetical protein
MKLFSERLSQSLGLKHGVPVYVFRLGQVHGELQSCSESLKRGLISNSGPVIVPDQPSNAIFVFSISEAIRAILFERITPGTYTLISHPAWSFADLVEWYTRKLGLNVTILTEDVKRSSAVAHGFIAFRAWVKQGLLGLVDYYKEFLSAIVSAYSVDLDQRLRFARTRKVAAASITAYFDSLSYRPFEALNELPGLRFPFTSDIRATMEEPEQRVEDLIRHLK